MPRPERKVWCLFCGEYRKRGREHAWSEWLRKRAEKRGIRGTVSVFRLDPQGRLVRERNKDVPFTRRVRDVCEVCNGGWMKAIEDAVCDLLEPVIFDGAQTSFSADETRAIATWIFLRTLVLSYAADRTVTPRWFYRRLETIRTRPIASCRIWIGALSEMDLLSPPFYAFEIEFPKGVGGRQDGPRGYLATFAIGYLVGRVFMYPEALHGSFDLGVVNNGQYDGLLNSIWPNPGVANWPTQRFEPVWLGRLLNSMVLFPRDPRLPFTRWRNG